MTVRLSMLVLAAPIASLVSCSDPPPAPARAAVEMQLQPPASTIPNIGTRQTCTAGSTGTYRYFLGRVPSGLTAQERVRNSLLESGQQGFNATCTVKSLGGGRYSVSASVSGIDGNSRRGYTSMSLNGTLNATGPVASNPGQFRFYSPDTLNLRTISDLPGCTIGPVYVAKEGALLADFTCPVIADSSDTVKGCQATGTIAVERCRTGKEDD